MPTRYAVNGFGRIGRALVRVAADRPDLQLVAINDLAPPRVLARLLARDSLYGRGAVPVAALDGALEIGGRMVPVIAAPTPNVSMVQLVVELRRSGGLPGARGVP